MLDYNDTIIKSMIYNGQKVKKCFYNGVLVFSAGNNVTYIVDNGVSYVEEVESDATCLAPKTFTPTKNGWTFVGWRSDKTANGTVLTSLVMGDNPITLYAVFKQKINVTFIDESRQYTDSSFRYYNNGAVLNPEFFGEQYITDNYYPIGWSTSQAADAAVMYEDCVYFTTDHDMTLYALYEKEITCLFYSGLNNANAQRVRGLKRCNASGNTIGASIIVPNGAGISGWTWRGWSGNGGTSASAGVAYGNGATISGLTTGITCYGLYQAPRRLYFDGNGADSGSVATQLEYSYYNACGNTIHPTFTLPANGFGKAGHTFTGWMLNADSTLWGVGSKVILDWDRTAYAQWKAQFVTFYGKFKHESDGQLYYESHPANGYYRYGTCYSEWKNTTGRDVTVKVTITNKCGSYDTSSGASIYVNTGGMDDHSNMQMRIEHEDPIYSKTITQNINVPANYFMVWFNQNDAHTTITAEIL